MQLFYEPAANPSNFILNSEEARHCLKVLRHKKGDSIRIVDGKGTYYTCELVNDHIKKCEVRVISTSSEASIEGYRHIAIAPTKNLDRIEWFVEKSVEIGIDEISFIICQNSERKIIKLDRVARKAISAMKQSVKAICPIINAPIDYTSFITNPTTAIKYIAHVDHGNTEHLMGTLSIKDHNLIVIGPEGDFSTKELELSKQNGFKTINLGHSRLRTETAGIVACTLLNNKI